MKHAIILLLLVLVAGCAKQEQQGDGQTGSASSSVSADIIGSDMGYIVENAQLVGKDAVAAFSIKGQMKLAAGPGNVLIVRTQSADGNFTEMLALGFPAFAEGTRVDFQPGGSDAGYWIFGVTEEAEIMKQTGTIEGSIRLVKKESAENALGLNRDVQNGVGEIEVVVTAIENRDLPVEAEKKFAARFRLPLITLDELARINQPI